MKKGISVVMVNTEKGAAFYKKTIPLIYSEKSSLEKAISGNACILNSPKFNHEKRAEFFRRIENENFSDLVFDIEDTSKLKVLVYEKIVWVKSWVIKWIKAAMKK